VDSGFSERAHTADWALDVWAPDFLGLAAAAARGMYALMQVQPKRGDGVTPDDRVIHHLDVTGLDDESRLVAFLSELLYYLERENLVFDQIRLSHSGESLFGDLEGGHSSKPSKEIKAVTYHNLKIESTPQGLRTTIVFDV